MDQTITRPEAYRWANTDPKTGKLIDPATHSAARLQQRSIRRHRSSSGEKAAVTVGKHRGRGESSSIVTGGSYLGRNSGWHPRAESMDENEGNDPSKPYTPLLRDSLRPNMSRQFSKAEGESEFKFFKNVVPTHPETPRSATAIRLPRPPTATTVAMLNGEGSSTKKKRQQCTVQQRGRGGACHRSSTSPSVSQAGGGEVGCSEPKRRSPALTETNGATDFSPPTAGTGGALLRATYWGRALPGFSTAPDAMLVIPHTSDAAKIDVLERRIVEARQSPRRQALLQQGQDQIDRDAEHQSIVDDEERRKNNRRTGGSGLKKKDFHQQSKTDLCLALNLGARSSLSLGQLPSTARTRAAPRTATPRAGAGTSPARSATGISATSGVSAGFIPLNLVGADVASLANTGKNYSSLQFGHYRYGKPPSLLDDTQPMPLNKLEDMTATHLCEAKLIEGRANIRSETFSELDRFDDVIAVRGTGIGGGGEGKVIYEESLNTATAREVEAMICGSPLIPAGDQSRNGGTGGGHTKVGSSVPTNTKHGVSDLSSPDTTQLLSSAVPQHAQPGGAGDGEDSVVSTPSRHRKVGRGGSAGTGAGGQNAEVINKDYQLIRMLFQIELMDNTKANKALRAIGEDMIVRRLALVKRRFGSKRLDKGEFFYAMELLIGVGTLTRADSDTFFDMFDTNQSGGVDESEFLAGIRMTLHDQKRSLASYCRRLMDARQALGTVITMMEIELLLHAVAEVAKSQYPGIMEDCQSVIDELQPQSHHSQVPIIFFRAAVNDTRLLSTVLKEISVDATFPKVPTPPPSPSPQDSFNAILLEVEEEARRATQITNSKEQRRKSGSPARGGGRRRSSRTPSTIHMVSNASLADEAMSGAAPHQPKHPVLEASLPVGEDPLALSAAAAQSGKDRPIVDVKNRRFRADQFMRSGQDLGEDPGEHHNPQWYLKNGVVWKTSDLTGPMTMTS